MALKEKLALITPTNQTAYPYGRHDVMKSIPKKFDVERAKRHLTTYVLY